MLTRVRTASPRLRKSLAEAKRLADAGALLDAEFAYEACLLTEPDCLDALLGVAACAFQREAFETAEARAARATALAPRDATAWRIRARACRRLGRAADAERCLREAVAADAQDLDARVDLGIVLRARGDFEGAAEQYRYVLERRPGAFEAVVNLANVLADQGKGELALEQYRAAMRLRPESGEAPANLARLLIGMQRFEDAEVLLRQARARLPDEALLVREQGCLHIARRQYLVARDILNQVAAMAPGDKRTWLLMGELATAVHAYDDAKRMLRRCLELDANDANALSNLSVVLRREDEPGESLALARRAVEADALMPEAHANVADALTTLGRADEADAIYTDIVGRLPVTLAANFLLTSNYVDRVTPREMAERHRWIGQRLCEVVPAPAPHANDPDPERRLRVGYLSGDFRTHSVAYFIEPVLRSHDPGRVEVFCYHTQAAPDAVTERLRQSASVWRQVEDLGDEALVQRIRDDAVDVLVDLSGHTAGNRTFTVARKPAPVQAIYLGYPGTSGMPAVDYRISDWQVDPAGDEWMNSERVVRLPHSYYCFAGGSAVEIGGPPCMRTGAVTFGSFNNLAKLSDMTLALWADVLHAVHGSRLLIKTRGLNDPVSREGVIARFAQRGIDAARLDLRGWMAARDSHLALYNEIDVALDSYPYNGATTTCEALWMGVPVVTLRGATHAARMGASLLSAAGLSDLIATDAAGFVRTATGLAGSPASLAALRTRLRAQLLASPLMDAEGFTRALEDAYRDMWRRWCGEARA
jgi:predicted O-linked N-acetylglucosamine transferase (SPINDLY family)